MKLAPVLPALAALLLAPGCTAAPELHDFDRWFRSTSQASIVTTPTLTLWSPFDGGFTDGFAEHVEEERARVFDLFALPAGDPVIVWLQADDDMGMEVRIEGGRFHAKLLGSAPAHGVLGAATDVVTLFVAPMRETRNEKGEPMRGTFGPGQYTSTIRHEMVHMAAVRCGLRGRSFWNEGVAEAVEHGEIHGDRLVPDAGHEEIRAVAKLPRKARSLRDLLEWSPRFPVEADDARFRALAHAFVVFLMERSEEERFVAAARRAFLLERGELLDLEQQWHAWLERVADPPSGS